MTLHRKIRQTAAYPLLMTLILQFGITSLLCATSSYSANAMTICTSVGIKTITITYDENGNPVEQDSQSHAFNKNCFHCSSGCGSLAMLPSTTQEIRIAIAPAYQSLTKISVPDNYDSQGPPTRAPPHFV